MKYRSTAVLAATLLASPALAQTPVYRNPAPTLVPGQAVAPNLDVNGNLKVNVVGSVGETVAISQVTPGTTNGVAIEQIGSTTAATGNGVTGAGSLRVTIASDNTAFTVNAAQATASSLKAQVGGFAANGATLVGNVVPIGGIDDNPFVRQWHMTAVGAGWVAPGINTAGADAVANSLAYTSTTDSGSVPVASASFIFNSSTFDRVRSAITGTDSTGTGIAAEAQLGQLDDTSPSTVTENRFGNIRIGAQRQQLNSPLGAYPYSAILGAPATPIRGASGNVAAGNAVATLTGTATTTVYITGFTCTMGGATAAAEVDIAITGTLGGTMTYTQGAPLGAGVPPSVINVQFSPAFPASAVNTAIVVTQPSGGTGNAHSACVATGFYL